MFSRKLVAIAVLSFAAAGAAQATDSHSFGHNYVPRQALFGFFNRDRKDPKKPTMVAPEIDPATAFSGFTMLAGGLAVIRGRRQQKK